MRLVELTIRNFRGFGLNAVTIHLNKDLTLLFGPNGFGKTSLAESIEWLFYGVTKRRQRGEAYSRAEYAGCYANVHGGTPVEVSAVVDINGTEFTFMRRQTGADGSDTFIDGRAASFGSLGINPIDAVYPVVAQHGLQTFIHSKPKERRDAICAALGLDELTALKSALDTARASFQRTPPGPVVAARRELSTNVAALAEVPATAALAARWRQTNMQVDDARDLPDLLKAAEQLSGQVCPSLDVALTALRTARAVAGRAVFDSRPLEPSDDPPTVLEAITRNHAAAVEAIANLERRVAAVVAAMTATYGSVLLEFWKTGLELSPGDDICPMCEAPTLNEARRLELTRRLAAGATVLATNKALSEAVGDARKVVASTRAALADFGAAGLPDAQMARLRQLLVDAPEPFDRFLAAHDQVVQARGAAEVVLVDTERLFDDCVARLAVPENAPLVVVESGEVREKFSRSLSAWETPLRHYLDEWQIFRPLLAARIASNDFVGRIDAVGKTLKDAQYINILTRYSAALAETQTLIQKVERRIGAKQAALLSTRGVEVKDYYGRLNGSGDVGFDVMEPGTDSLKLHAVSYGRRMSAAANLSECQLNCLGLAVWLMRANTPGSPFDFIVLDDPVQSMDDIHAEAFIADLVPHLLDDHQKQVIVLSHTQAIVDRLRSLNQHRDCRVYHFESYDRAGPQITEQIRLAMLLADIKGSAKGNERNREYAIDRIRVLAEQFIRELHLTATGAPLPAQYDRAMAKDLLPLFRTIPNTTQPEFTGLRDTIQFSDPAHHTQAGYSVPMRANIEPHISRLEQLLTKYALI